MLNTTPNVYATNQGGGSGDSRINVRGFSQRNVAIMINGVPVNDMENGWVYWSNWDGIGDVSSSIQVQRGLSAVNLAVPSIGGTVNILTDPATAQRGGKIKLEVGNDDFFKGTIVGHTGLIDDRFALSAAVVHKTGDGYIDSTWTDAQAYYVGSSFIVDDRNRLDFFLVGAPQRHGQNLYERNIGSFDHDFARGLATYDEAALAENREHGYKYNETWNFVDPSYDGKQAFNGNIERRQFSDIINERENFYHKPQANLNWYLDINDEMKLSTVLYYSGGEGGGTGTYGSVARVRDEDSPFYRNRDWDGQIAINRGTVDGRGNAKVAGQSTGILRNSRNNQWTIGAISKLDWEVTPEFTISTGLDWRTAEIEHYREVRDLLGGDYYVDSSSDFWTTDEQQRRGLGDKINYDFTNNVDWIGAFLQGQYELENVILYGMGGWSSIKYDHENFFINDGGSTLKVESDNIDGYQLKGGATYKFNDNFFAFGSLGYVEKVPIFDNVINDRNGSLNPNPENEKFTSYEIGAGYNTGDGMFDARANYYYTKWEDRAFTQAVRDTDGNDIGITNISGVNQEHSGFEAEIGYNPAEWVRLSLAGSINKWEYTDDVRGSFTPNIAGADSVEYGLYIADLKVGDAPQTQVVFGTECKPIDGMSAKFLTRYYDDHSSDFDPLGRTDETDRTQSWVIPSYWVTDFHFNFDLPIEGHQISVFAHVFNLFDETYIQDATDNGRFTSFDGDHDADDAGVFFGTGLTWNLGVSVDF